MDARKFDGYIRAFAQPSSRRRLLAAAGGLVALRSGSGFAAQAGPSTCGSAGDVCTMLLGCCSGMTCVTSAINVNYGVCITGGDGGTMASGTSLISPFSETLEQEIGTIEPTDTTAIDDREAELEQRKADKKARRDARQSKRKSRNTTQQNRRETKRDDRDLRKGPKVDVSLQVPSNMDEVNPEVVSVTNETDSSVFISRINTVKDNRTASTTSHTLGSGDTLFFLSGLPNGTEVDDDEFLWNNTYVCSDPNDGFEVTAGFNTDTNNRVFTVLCNGTVPDDSNSAKRRRRKRKKKQAQAKKKGGNKNRHKNK